MKIPIRYPTDACIIKTKYESYTYGIYTALFSLLRCNEIFQTEDSLKAKIEFLVYDFEEHERSTFLPIKKCSSGSISEEYYGENKETVYSLIPTTKSIEIELYKLKFI